MNELLWILVGNTLFLAAAAAGAIWRITVAYRQAMEHSSGDQKLLHRLLKDAQDRIHAASLSDYLAIRQEGESAARPKVFSRSDEEEAAIEEARLNGGRY